MSHWEGQYRVICIAAKPCGRFRSIDDTLFELPAHFSNIIKSKNDSGFVSRGERLINGICPYRELFSLLPRPNLEDIIAGGSSSCGLRRLFHVVE